MRGFLPRDVRAAVGFALGGGQALHLHTLGCGTTSPGVFRQAVGNGQWIAHLFDQDTARLVKTAKELGVRKIVVDRPGEPAQHVDLCGLPLARALAGCENRGELPGAPTAPPTVELVELVELVEFEAEYQQHPPEPPPEPPAAPPDDEPRFGNLPSLFHPPRRHGQ